MTKETKDEVEEKTKGKTRPIIVALGVVILVLAGLSFYLSKKPSGPMGVDPSAAFFEKLQAEAEKALRFEFSSTREIQSGVGLKDWFDEIPSKDSVASVKANAVAVYSLDPKGDWDLSRRDGHVVIMAPVPEFKSFLVDPLTISVTGKNGPIPTEDQQTMLEILREKMPPLMREDEDARLKERLAFIRGRLNEFAAKTLAEDAKNVRVLFPGDGQGSEDGR